MAKDRRSRDQKRKAKLVKKNSTSRQSVSLAYMGDKFKTKELIPSLMNAEIGIYETYVMTNRKLLDHTVVAALENLIRQMGVGTLPPVSDVAEVHYEVGQEDQLVIDNIRRNWARYYQTEWKPPKDQRLGVLRTILGSIETMRAPGPRSQSYIHHIAGFLTKKLGVKVKSFSKDMTPLPEPEDDELLQLGHQWTCDGDETAKDEFHEVVNDMIQSGQAQTVLDSCHRLLGEESDPASEVVADLTEVIDKARKSLVTAMG
jgi:hypothetical protein